MFKEEKLAENIHHADTSAGLLKQLQSVYRKGNTLYGINVTNYCLVTNHLLVTMQYLIAYGTGKLQNVERFRYLSHVLSHNIKTPWQCGGISRKGGTPGVESLIYSPARRSSRPYPVCFTRRWQRWHSSTGVNPGPYSHQGCGSLKDSTWRRYAG